MWGKQNIWCAKLKCYFSVIFSLFGAFSIHIHIEGLSNVPAFIHFILTSCATHSNLQIMPLFLVLFNYVGFHPSFSRHSITRASSVLLIWLNENVGFHPSFSRHGITRASSVLLIWLNENVLFLLLFYRIGLWCCHFCPFCLCTFRVCSFLCKRLLNNQKEPHQLV